MMATSLEVVVNTNDILCGKGAGFLKHPGNKAFRALVMGLAGKYASSNQVERSKVLDEIMTKVEQNGGRFLKRRKNHNENICWCIVPHDNARLKTAQAFEDVLFRLRLGNDDDVAVETAIVRIDILRRRRSSKNDQQPRKHGANQRVVPDSSAPMILFLIHVTTQPM